MSRRLLRAAGPAYIFLLGMIVLVSVGVSEATEFEDTITFEKTWTHMQCDGDGNCSEKYLVRSTSGEVFQITDSLYRAQFRSSDIWSDMDKYFGRTILTRFLRLPGIVWMPIF